MTLLVEWVLVFLLFGLPLAATFSWHLSWGLGYTGTTRITSPLYPCCLAQHNPGFTRNGGLKGSITREYKSNIKVLLRPNFGSCIILSLPHSIERNEVEAGTGENK